MSKRPTPSAAESAALESRGAVDVAGRLSWLGRHPRLAAGLLFAVVLLVFLPTLRNDFITYDDNGYVTENAWVRQGLSWANVVHAFQTTEIAYWHPLTWISHLVDVELFGLHPWGHHLTSVLWHAANAALLFAVLSRLTGAVGASWFVAALFGLHPLHVESVAWVAERKDVLSTFFSLLALAAYARWVTERRWTAYGLALVAFAAGLMSKPMVVTLPCVFLLLDVWPLGRWRAAAPREMAATFGRRLVEKLPFFALAAAASLAAVKAQALLGTLQTTTDYSVGVRVGNALVAYVGYLAKAFWPVNLAVFYPHPGALPVGPVVAAGAFLGLVTVVVLWSARRRPWLPVGWFWFLGTLVPVIGLVQVGGQAMADRYSYLSLVGIFIMVGWSLREWCPPERRPLLVGAALAVLVACGVQTERQIARWHDSPALFRHALAVTERNWAAHFALGYYYAKDPATIDEAITEYRATLSLTPEAAEAHHSLAAMLARRPETRAEAVAEFQQALSIAPDNLEAQLGLGQVLQRLAGREAEAVVVLERARRQAPGDHAVIVALSGAYAAAGRASVRRAPDRDEGLADLRSAVTVWPDNAEARLSLADALAARPGAVTEAEAVAEYREVLRLRPDWIEVRNNLALVLERQPDGLAAASDEYETLLRAKPDLADAHANFANLLARLPGRATEAEREYRTTLRLRPDDFRDHFNYGVFLFNAGGRESEAAVQFEAALQLRPDLTPAREILQRLRRGAR